MIEINSFTAILHLDLHIPQSTSLKEKRRVLLSLKTKLKNKFNVSVAEVGKQDKWQRALLGLSLISGDQKYLRSQVEKIKNLIERVHEVEMLDEDLEIIT